MNKGECQFATVKALNALTLPPFPFYEPTKGRKIGPMNARKIGGLGFGIESNRIGLRNSAVSAAVCHGLLKKRD